MSSHVLFVFPLLNQKWENQKYLTKPFQRPNEANMSRCRTWGNIFFKFCRCRRIGPTFTSFLMSNSSGSFKLKFTRHLK